MGNRNKNVVKGAEDKQRKLAIKTYHSNNRSEFLALFAVIAYAILFGIISIINDSAFFSLILAVFSFTTTLGFELVDWLKYLSNKSSKKQCLFVQLIFKYYTNALLIGVLIFLVIIAPFSVYAQYDADSYKQFALNIDSHLPNIITSVTFATYFISFYVRNYLIKRDAFLSSLKK